MSLYGEKKKIEKNSHNVLGRKNSFGYALIGVIAGAALMSYLSLGLVSFFSTGAKVKSKAYMDLYRDFLIDEIRYVLRDSEDCNANLRNQIIPQDEQAVNTLPEDFILKDWEGSDSTSIVRVGQDYGREWIIKSFALKNFQKQSHDTTKNIAKGFLDFMIELQPTLNKHYESNSIYTLSVTTTVDTSSSDWKLKNCSTLDSFELTDIKVKMCEALSGTLRYNRCSNTKFSDGINVGEALSTTEIDINVPFTDQVPVRGIRTLDLKVDPQDSSLVAIKDFKELTAVEISASNISFPNSLLVPGNLYYKSIQTENASLSTSFDSQVLCTGPNEYMAGVNFSTWTAICKSR